MEFPQLSIEQKLEMREARYQANRLKEMARQAELAVWHLVEKVAQEVGADSKTMVFNEDALQFVAKQ